MKSITKKWLCAAAKLMLFLVLFGLIYTLLLNVFINKEYTQALALIEEQPDGKYDVILAGPSHMQFAVQPAQLFGEYGIASCNVSTTAQSIPSTYHLIKEMIDRHDPELVVVDLFCLFYPEIAFAPERIHQTMDFFPLSKNKIVAIQDLVRENRAEFYFPIMLFHGRWKSLTREDYMMYFDTNETYQLLSGTEVFSAPFTPVPIEETVDIPEIPLRYLKKITDLCKETETQLLLTVVPYRADVDNNGVTAVYQQQIYNKAAELADAWGVDFLNGLHHLEDMHFDFTTDMMEYSHVNVSGAQKISAYYGKHFREHYTLPDRIKDASYADWYADYEEYLEQIELLVSN